MTTRTFGVTVLAAVVVLVISLAPQPVTLVQNETVDVVVVTARFLSLRNSVNGIRGASVSTAAESTLRLATTPYDKVVVQTSAVAVLQLNSSGSGCLGYVGLRSAPMLVESNPNLLAGAHTGKKKGKEKKKDLT
jgi:hypothetical protein